MPSCLVGLQELFEKANGVEGKRDHDEPTRFEASVIDGTRETIANDYDYDIVIIPPATEYTRGNLASPWHIDFLKTAQNRGKLIGASCVGVFLLAEACIIDDHRITTHPALADELRRRCPAADVVADEPILVDRGIFTAGGTMNWFELALRIMVAVGREQTVRALAEHYFISREGLTYILPPKDDRILRTIRWIEQHYADDVQVTDLATYARLGVRTFQRRFSAATGVSPSAFLQSIRVRKAREFLRTTQESIGDIARAVGYQDQPSFTRLFQRHVGVSPAAFRRSVREESGPKPLSMTSMRSSG